jgi:hypothetical protein
MSDNTDLFHKKFLAFVHFPNRILTAVSTCSYRRVYIRQSAPVSPNNEDVPQVPGIARPPRLTLKLTTLNGTQLRGISQPRALSRDQ